MALAAAPKKSATAAAQKISFLNLDIYTGMGSVPEDNYLWKDVSTVMHGGFGEKKYTPVLGVMITMNSVTAPTEKDRQEFYSMGQKAAHSFAPDAETGKGLVAVPGAKATSLNNNTKWALLLQSLYNSALPAGLADDDLSVLDGITVHMQNVPTPESWKTGAKTSATAEVQEDRGKAPEQIAVVSEIVSAPWMEATDAPAPVKTAPKAATAPKPAAKATPAPVAVEEEAVEEEEDETLKAAIDGITTVLTVPANSKECSKLLLKTSTFKAVTAVNGEDVAQAVLDTYFIDDAALSSVLKTLGYVIVGGKVKVKVD